MSKLLDALSPTPSNWSNTKHYCDWKNVICDSTLRVTSINLSYQSLSGTLPSDLGTLTQLTYLLLQRNFFSGPIPSFANLTSLQVLRLDTNNFTSIPNGFFQGTHQLTAIPTFLGPYLISSTTSQVLRDLQLSENNLTGPLPKSFGGSKIVLLWLENQSNGLSGNIDVLSSMTKLYQAVLFKNQFTGPIPDLSNCTDLFDLQIRDNQLTGLVPDSLMSIPTLKNISLDNNMLQGPYPKFPSFVTHVTLNGINTFCNNIPGPCDPQVTILLEVAAALGYPIKLAISWKGNNVCDGWTFIMCDSVGKVITVNFTKQGFVGMISPAFTKLTSLRNLYLSDNNLTGSIPDALANLTTLQALDVSNNNLTGLIPKFASTVTLTTIGNPLLSSSPSDSNGTRTGLSAGMIAGIVIAVVILVVVVLFVWIKCYVGRRHNKFGTEGNPDNGKEVFKNIDGSNVMISIEVIRQATNIFSEDNILGRGGFGVVYKGELHDGTKIAVKRMKSVAVSSKEIKQFDAEIAVLTKVRHRHLVALLGYCLNDNERLLVFEYMPQGTLTQHLFHWGENGCSPLTWKERIIIALDVARGVEYLHSLAQQSFIHRDLKPSNILLGNDRRAKVADFGLVKNVPDGKYSVETQLAGTYGYFAPEYAATGRVTTKVDVYAFGVILMELITGRKALDNTMPDDRFHLVTWFRQILINENISNAIDQILNPDEETMESIYKVVELAGHCTTRDPYQRPDMGHAVNILSTLVEQWKPTCHEEEHAYSTFHGKEETYGIDQHMSFSLTLER
uniref:Protein kinase domain-containing protein n=1 Tax=Fagus sylvatica TaxID=28930 RepID=A0A2N9ITI3_FAGSY